MYDAIIELI
jgi:hypothetical protein